MNGKLTKVDFTTGKFYDLGVSENSIDINIKDIRTNLINEQFHQETATETMFALDVSAQSRSFTVVSSTGFTVGDTIKIKDGVVEYNYPKILTIVGNVVTIDRPLDKSYNTTDGIIKIITNMAVNGSITPQSFKIKAENAIAVSHITRILFNMIHGTAADVNKFGGIAALTKGVLIRAYYERAGVYKTVTNWKNNGDISKDVYDISYDDRAGGSGSYGTSGRWTFTNAGIVAELFPNDIDFIEVLVQDDLTGLDSFIINAQGHTVD